MTSLDPTAAVRTGRPLLRVLGSAVGWVAFTFFLVLLYLGAQTVMLENGGYCASGGPYEIASGHQCSEAVLLAVPGSVFGGLGAVVLATVLARGFGVPVLGWAWSALFGLLGYGFFAGFAAVGWAGVSWLVCGLLFAGMALGPLFFFGREGWRLLLGGETDAWDVPFAGTGPTGRIAGGVYRSVSRAPQARAAADAALRERLLAAGFDPEEVDRRLGFAPAAPAAPPGPERAGRRPHGPTDYLLAWGVCIPSVALGAWLAVQAFAGLAGLG